MAHKHNRRRVRSSWDPRSSLDHSAFARHHSPSRDAITSQPWRRASVASSSSFSSFSSSLSSSFPSSTHGIQTPAAHTASSSPVLPTLIPTATSALPSSNISRSPSLTSTRALNNANPAGTWPTIPNAMNLRQWQGWNRQHRNTRGTWQHTRTITNSTYATAATTSGHNNTDRTADAQREQEREQACALAARQKFEAQQIKLFGGEPGDDPELCFRMLEYFGGLDYMR